MDRARPLEPTPQTPHERVDAADPIVHVIGRGAPLPNLGSRPKPPARHFLGNLPFRLARQQRRLTHSTHPAGTDER